MDLSIDEPTLATLKALFIKVEGNCEVWDDDEVVRRMLIRGAMEYAKSAGQPWDQVQALSKELRAALSQRP